MRCFIIFSLISGVTAFVTSNHLPAFVLHLQLTRRTPSNIPLSAKKKPKNKKAVSGKGFGSNSDTATSSTTTPQSGYTGAKALRTAANNFDRIRQQHGVQACQDVYVRSPLNSPTTFWFVGKIAKQQDDNDISFAQAALAQKRLILDYATHELRPQNLAGKYNAALELWLAPGDSEMDVVQNKITLQAVSKVNIENVSLSSVGYNPEIYVGDEKTQGGLRVERDEEGKPTKPVFEINESA